VVCSVVILCVILCGVFSCYTVCNVVWCRVVLFVVCVTMATVPQKLIEFRYFIIPYIMMR